MQLIDCDRGPPLYDLGCDGGDFEGGIRYIAENGIDLESDYPYLAKDGACRRAAGHAACCLSHCRFLQMHIFKQLATVTVSKAGGICCSVDCPWAFTVKHVANSAASAQAG